MPLPKISHIVYPITFKSVGLETTFRPFTVAEERILLHIKDSKDPAFIKANIKSLITNCVQSKLDVDKMATYDIENFLLRVRAKSVGEIVDVVYTDPESKTKLKGKLNLESIRVVESEDHKAKVEITDEIGLMLKDPDFATILSLQSSQDDPDVVWKLIVACVDKIYDANDVYVSGVDTTIDEVQDFVNDLPHEVSKRLIAYINTMPHLEADLTLEDGRVIPITGLMNFLA